eukprot:757964-Hanusia_phi.AAC.2
MTIFVFSILVKSLAGRWSRNLERKLKGLKDCRTKFQVLKAPLRKKIDRSTVILLMMLVDVLSMFLRVEVMLKEYALLRKDVDCL